jgi:hypothetical protein
MRFQIQECSLADGKWLIADGNQPSAMRHLLSAIG